VNSSPVGDRSSKIQPFPVRLRFFGDLSFFLRRTEHPPFVERVLNEQTSVKDAIEACGVPHPEIDRITVDAHPVNFLHLLQRKCSVDVYPVGFAQFDDNETPLQRPNVTAFVSDGHLGKMTRNLRLLGIDVVSPTSSEDQRLLEIMEREKRALLTRDRRLLMHRIVRDGFYPRSQQPDRQTIEVIRRFQLFNFLAPFSRCLRCNGSFKTVAKAKILHTLEPLTRVYYEEFRRCQDCGKIYWRGSHFDKLQGRIEELRAKMRPDSA
jgi:uncharacterized protein